MILLLEFSASSDPLSSACTACAAGQRQVAATGGAQCFTCVNCGVNEFSNTTTSPSCTACAVGTFTNTTASTTCQGELICCVVVFLVLLVIFLFNCSCLIAVFRLQLVLRVLLARSLLE